MSQPPQGTAGPPGARIGNLDRRIWAIAAPIIAANLSTPLLGAVDTAVVGFLDDPAPIGAVAVGAIVFSFIFWAFGFLRQATSGFAAQAFGAGDAAELRATFARPMLLAGLLGLAVILLQTPLGWLAFEFVDASDRVGELAEDYYRIRIWAAPATLANYALLGWLLGTQRAFSAFFLQLVLNGTNIALDLLFVVQFGWGVEGVAIASVVAECLAMLLGLALAARVLRQDGGHWQWPRILDRHKLMRLFRVNLDILLRNLGLTLAFAYFTRQSAQLGDVTLAANAVLLHFFTFTAYGLDGFAHAVEVIAGSAIGARSKAVYRGAVAASTRWAAGFAVLIALLFALVGTDFIALFTNLDDVKAIAGRFLPWVVALPLVSVWSFQLDGIFIGAVRSAEIRNAMAVSLLFFLGACWLLVAPYGNHGLWLAMTIFMAARAVTLWIYFPRIERGIV